MSQMAQAGVAPASRSSQSPQPALSSQHPPAPLASSPDSLMPAGVAVAVPAGVPVMAPVARPADPVTRLLLRIGRRLPGWGAPLAVAVCFVGGVAYTLLSHPTVSGANDSPTCVLKLTTGFDCPGCGGTRAFWYLLHGDLPAAARSHLIAVFAAPFLIYMYVAWAARSAFGLRLPSLRFGPKTVSIFLGVWAAFAVLRNLPWAPFTWFFV